MAIVVSRRYVFVRKAGQGIDLEPASAADLSKMKIEVSDAKGGRAVLAEQVGANAYRVGETIPPHAGHCCSLNGPVPLVLSEVSRRFAESLLTFGVLPPVHGADVLAVGDTQAAANASTASTSRLTRLPCLTAGSWC